VLSRRAFLKLSLLAASALVARGMPAPARAAALPAPQPRGLRVPLAVGPAHRAWLPLVIR